MSFDIGLEFLCSPAPTHGIVDLDLPFKIQNIGFTSPLSSQAIWNCSLYRASSQDLIFHIEIPNGAFKQLNTLLMAKTFYLPQKHKSSCSVMDCISICKQQGLCLWKRITFKMATRLGDRQSGFRTQFYHFLVLCEAASKELLRSIKTCIQMVLNPSYSLTR